MKIKAEGISLKRVSYNNKRSKKKSQKQKSISRMPTRHRNRDRSMCFPPRKYFQKISHIQFKRGLILQCSKLVGVTGFEPAASWSRTKRTTKLCHTPIVSYNCCISDLLFAAPCDWWGNRTAEQIWFCVFCLSYVIWYVPTTTTLYHTRARLSTFFTKILYYIR